MHPRHSHTRPLQPSYSGPLIFLSPFQPSRSSSPTPLFPFLLVLHSVFIITFWKTNDSKKKTLFEDELSLHPPRPHKLFFHRTHRLRTKTTFPGKTRTEQHTFQMSNRPRASNTSDTKSIFVVVHHSMQRATVRRTCARAVWTAHFSGARDSW